VLVRIFLFIRSQLKKGKADQEKKILKKHFIRRHGTPSVKRQLTSQPIETLSE
jgi:hypothetical protein